MSRESLAYSLLFQIFMKVLYEKDLDFSNSNSVERTIEKRKQKYSLAT